MGEMNDRIRPAISQWHQTKVWSAMEIGKTAGQSILTDPRCCTRPVSMETAQIPPQTDGIIANINMRSRQDRKEDGSPAAKPHPCPSAGR